jgi:hypothetical protein
MENLNENKTAEKNTSENKYLPDGLSKCLNLKLFRGYYFILFLMSVAANLIIIYIILKNRKKLLHHVNILTLVLAMLNFIGIIVEMLVAIVESASKCNNK